MPLGQDPFPRSGLPEPETVGRRRLTQVVIIIAIAVGVAYLAWRIVASVNMRVWWVSVPLLVLEAHALVGLMLFATSLWDLDAVAPADPIETTRHRLAILLPTYNEPVEILLPAIAGAVSARLLHSTWVLDDGDRPEVAELARRLGAQYLSRPTHEHAKAGNVNHALGHVDADLIAILDADHVAQSDLLAKTVGYFDDARVALVQTPQDFYNLDSFEHGKNYQDQQLFYRGIQPGRNRWGAAFWCGTGAVVRVTALREVGGLATETVTEDIHTTIRLHRRGWRTVYHNEVLARGLAAGDALQYLNQRLRWGTGSMQVLRQENPAWVSGLRPMQRVSYLATLLGWFDAWRSLGYLLVPMAVLTTGAVPIRSSLQVFLPVFAVAFLVQRYALYRMARGLAPQGLAVVFDLVRMPANLQATLRLLVPGERAFSVTAKGRTGDQRERMPVPALLTALLAGSLLTAGWAVSTLYGLTPLHYGARWAAYGALLWLLVNGGLLLAAVQRIRSQRFGAERRSSVRFKVDAAASLDDCPVRLLDASLTGAKLLVGAGGPVPGDHVRLAIDLDTDHLVLPMQALVRACWPVGETGATVVGVEFSLHQEREQAAMALALFATGAAQLLPDGELWLSADDDALLLQVIAEQLNPQAAGAILAQPELPLGRAVEQPDD
jgi:cellulose synthase (UDP-forming)